MKPREIKFALFTIPCLFLAGCETTPNSSNTSLAQFMKDVKSEHPDLLHSCPEIELKTLESVAKYCFAQSLSKYDASAVWSDHFLSRGYKFIPHPQNLVYLGDLSHESASTVLFMEREQSSCDEKIVLVVVDKVSDTFSESAIIDLGCGFAE